MSEQNDLDSSVVVDKEDIVEQYAQSMEALNPILDDRDVFMLKSITAAYALATVAYGVVSTEDDGIEKEFIKEVPVIGKEWNMVATEIQEEASASIMPIKYNEAVGTTIAGVGMIGLASIAVIKALRSKITKWHVKFLRTYYKPLPDSTQQKIDNQLRFLIKFNDLMVKMVQKFMRRKSKELE